MQTKLAGWFKFVVHHGDTNIVLRETNWAPNLITDYGLNLIADGWGTFYCAVGSGVAVPTFTSTTLSNWLATSASVGGYVGGTNSVDGYGWFRYSFTFGIGAIQGTISEIGLTKQTAIPTNLLTYAPLTEAGGVPTTLTLGGVDRLTVYYEFRQYWPTEDMPFNAVINGVERACTARVANYGGWQCRVDYAAGYPQTSYGTPLLQSYITTLGAVGSGPSGTGNNASSLYTNTYVQNSFSRDWGVTWADSKGIMNDMRTFYVYDVRGSIGGCWQIEISPTISKTELESFRLDWRTIWSRYGS